MSDVTLSLGVDASQMESGLGKAKSALKGLEAQANQKGIFERLNNDVKNLGGTFSTLKDQLAGGNIVGALATVSKAGSSMGPLAPLLGGVGLAMAGVAVAAGGMWSAMSRAKEMRNTAEQSGLLVTELMPLQKIFGQVGLEAEQIPAVMTQLRGALETLGDPASKASKAFEKIGLNAESFKGKSYYEALKLIGGALGSAKDKTDALNAATEAFGAKKGVKVGQALAGADFGKMEATTPESAEIIQEQGEMFQKFQLAIAKLKPSLDSFFLGMASNVIPALVDAAAKIEKMDLAGMGKSFGDNIAAGITKALELKERLAFVMATPAERREMQAQKVKDYEEERKKQLIPGYAEAQKAAEPQLYNYPMASEGPQAARGANVSTGEAKALKIERPESLMSSIAKMGGGASGMGVDSLNVQREQLSVMQQMLAALRGSTNAQGRAPMIDIYGNSEIAVTA
jgi:hypothetical protein